MKHLKLQILLIGTIVGFTYVSIMFFMYPISPLDLGFYLTKMLETLLYYKNNGIEIQWYSPAIGGGLPSFPNPQQTQFSIIQFLLFAFPPWISVCLDIFIMAFLGFIGAFLLLHRTCKISDKNAILGALCFSLGGFQIEHIIVGHQFFELFALSPLVLYLIFIPNRGLSTMVNSLITAYFIYNAGFYPLYCTFMTVSISAAVILFHNAAEFKTIFLTFQRYYISILIGLIIGASKISAMIHFMRFFERDLHIFYGNDFLIAFFLQIKQLVLAQLVGTFANIYLINRWLSNCMHETDVCLPPTFLLLAGIAIYLSIKNKKKLAPFDLRSKYLLLFIVLFFFLFNFSLSSTYGVLYPFLKSLPILKSFSSVVRLVIVWNLPLIILVLLILEKNNFRFKNLYFTVILFLTFSCFFITYIKTAVMNSNPYHENVFDVDLKKVNLVWEKIIANNQKIKVYTLEDDLHDPLPMLHQASSHHLSDPIFWSSSDNVLLKTKTGSVKKIENGFYNMTNPASLVFPEENNLQPWDLIASLDGENFEKFRSYKKPKWKISTTQKYMNWLSILSLMAVCLFLVISAFRQKRALNSTNEFLKPPL